MAAAAQVRALAQRAPRQTAEQRRTAERAPALPSLTGLRFCAALLVVGVHYGTRCLPWPLSSLAASGGLGVGLFFVLSGFILVHQYATPAGALRGTRRAFYRARLARIYPVYLLTLVLAAPLATSIRVPAYAAVPRGVSVAATLSLLQAWFPYGGFMGNRPGWSLSAEAFFYALFPLLLRPILALSPRRIVAALVLCWALKMLEPLAYLGLHLDRGVAGAPALWSALAYYNPLARLPEFVYGMLCARLVQMQRHAPPWAAPATTLVLSATLLSMALLAGLPAIWEAGSATMPLFGALLVCLAWGRGRMAAVLAARPLCALGEASYALYLLHWLLYPSLVRLLSSVGVRLGDVAASLPFFALYVGLTTGLALLVYRCVEAPARRVLRGASGPRRSAGARDGRPRALRRRARAHSCQNSTCV